MGAASLVFTVRKREPVMIPPSAPTPHELKPLSNIDDQPTLRFHISIIHIYRSTTSSLTDPAAAIRGALARALVFYYPLAGRLRELPGGKLAVETTGDGVIFVEAEADVRLDQFGPNPHPPFPCIQELIHDFDRSGDLLTAPILTIQLTRLRCGALVLAHRHNHTVLDGAGLVQFLKAVAELARGAAAPSVPPVWARELLAARDPPRVTHDHPEYDQLPAEPASAPSAAVCKSFFFGPREISAMRQHLPQGHATRFDVLTACLWRSRTVALGTPAGEEVRGRFIVNARRRCSPPLPAGFYGNAIAYPVARTTAGELRRNPLSYAVELVRAAKERVTEGYLQSVADLMAIRRRPLYAIAWTFKVSDVTRLGFEEIDFGWGEAVYSGPAVGGGPGVGAQSGINYIRYRNSKGEDGILVPVTLPGGPAMERFEKEIEQLTTPLNGTTSVQFRRLCSSRM